MFTKDAVNLSEMNITVFNNIKSNTFICSSPFECTLVLTEVIALNRPDDPRVQRDPFALVFEAPLACPVQQGMFSLSHPDIGHMEIFLVPVKQTNDSIIFEATFT